MNEFALFRGIAGPRTVAMVAAAALLYGCSSGNRPAATASPTATPTAVAATEESLEPAPEATPLPEGVAQFLRVPLKGDLDEMVKRRVVRVLTVQNPILYAVDKGREVGMTYEAIVAFEKQLNESLGNKTVLVHVVPVPIGREQMIPALLAGRGDLVAGMVRVTPERAKQVDFSLPLVSGVKDVLITGPGVPPAVSIEDLSGRHLYVRPSSSYAEGLRNLNARFKAEGRAPVVIDPAPEVLEDCDILEMVAAGLVPATVVNEHEADLYLKVFPALQKAPGLTSRPGDFAWAFRKGSPKLAAAVNAFVRKHAEGTLAGNVLLNKYLKTTRWVKNARSDEDRKRFETMVALFRKFGDQYGLDYVLMAAQGYQESGLDQSKRSSVGAIGVMQLMPTTARDKAVGIPDIEKLDRNIQAGCKYNRWMIDNFYNEPGISRLDRGLFAFASYNAGPGRVASLRRQAAAEGLDANRWFNNVELVAAKRIGRETVTYVSNIYKYYLAYKMMLTQREVRVAAKAGVAAEKGGNR